ncbi:hypothetical protein QF038_002334 [Pseudarthrobacter sp. W1I19]|uniref:hypothetical protein n=1 Tax=Pseudarthrobacter sp. W1I19 TaxID=3042288 RepID=UPI0027862084|nr:hypothetical protein [Pseudarthrobacter sp. W1I19]MDQ0923826.1 hypothetical protein [Pseudarthrobacter sp. W1I19]
MSKTDRPTVRNGDRIDAGEIADAVTRAPLAYSGEATQVFTPGGITTYTENGNRTYGKWGVNDQGQFWSFWPPTYCATYDVCWIVDAKDEVIGVRFIDVPGGAVSEGRYLPRLRPFSAGAHQ